MTLTPDLVIAFGLSVALILSIMEGLSAEIIIGIAAGLSGYLGQVTTSDGGKAKKENETGGGQQCEK